MKKAKIRELDPLFVSWDGFGKITGIAVSTLQNRLSEGSLPVKPRYFGTKPLFRVTEILAWVESLPSEPLVKRGRKRLSEAKISRSSKDAQE